MFAAAAIASVIAYGTPTLGLSRDMGAAPSVTSSLLGSTAGFKLDLAAPADMGAGLRDRFGLADNAFKARNPKAYLTDKLNALGIQTEKPSGGAAGRWYMFVAMRNQPIGTRSNWISRNSAMGTGVMGPSLLSDGKLGVGWTKGSFGASVGYAQRSVTAVNGPVGVSNGRTESVAALSFTFRPH